MSSFLSVAVRLNKVTVFSIRNGTLVKDMSSQQCQHPYCSRKADKSATMSAKDWYSIAGAISVPYCRCKLMSSQQCQQKIGTQLLAQFPSHTVVVSSCLRNNVSKGLVLNCWHNFRPILSL